ncbi:MAG: ABC transporter ATP-binding protein/permease [Coriobacteriales bacterium]|jgi:ATP-binding cassette subfamily B protein|nr:ABC transporter ATP-binding protein/permease [Coriobacteriales bacterium]
MDGKPAARGGGSKVGLGYLMGLAGRNRPLLALSALLSVLSGLCGFVPYVMVYQVLLFLFGGSADVQAALQYGLVAVVAIVLRALFQTLALGLSHVGAFNTLYSVRARISRHIGKIPLGFFSDHTSGEVKKVVIEDVERIEKFLAHQVPDVVAAVVVPIAVFVYLLTIHVPMALATLAPLVLGFVILGVALALTGRQMAPYQKLLERLNSSIMQFMNGMPVMKAFNLTTASYREYSDTVRHYAAFWRRATKLQGYPYGILVALIESSILFMLPIGGILFLDGSLAAETFVFFMIMGLVFLTGLLNLVNFAQLFAQITGGIARIKHIMDIPEGASGRLELPASGVHSLHFQDVGFAYGEAEVLHGLTLDLPAGTLTAFVGASGAGKTTAAQLIPQFWEVTGGSITIDGEGIGTLASENLMDLISFVFQETFMLNDTVYENIAIGKAGATQRDVEAAAEAAQIHGFIAGLPDGYQTRVGEGGTKLSGGERQRICIARAILKDAPIVIFDEATSFTDIENEHRIQLALSRLLQHKTTVMIAHRLHTIVGADQICVFDKGRIVERGTHEALLGKDGLYSRMWEAYGQEVPA